MSTKEALVCSQKLTKTMHLLGDFWVLSIVAILEKKKLRFCELERAISNINPTTLSSRLKTLEKEKILIKEEGVIDKISVTYKLTQKGINILPIIKEIDNFAEKYQKNNF